MVTNQLEGGICTSSLGDESGQQELVSLRSSRITLVCHDVPYPTNHGARVDMWRRIKALHRSGVELQLICWISHDLALDELAEIQTYVSRVHLIPFKKTPASVLFQAFELAFYPLEVTSRMIRGRQLDELMAQVRSFQPDAIFLDGLHGGKLATFLSEQLNVMLLTRSHNIEHLYYRRLLQSATGIRKLKRVLSLTHLEQYERSILSRSAIFYDISMDDLIFWQSQGFTHGRYLPPFIEPVEGEDSQQLVTTSARKPEYDIVFLGNLCSDNNVEGIDWFVTEVLPRVRATLPEITVLIAGSNPVKKVRKLCKEQRVEIHINPSCSMQTYQFGQVLVNPVKAGSGVSIKSIEMLMANRPIVSTPQGVAGLPDHVKPYFEIATDARSFAEAIVKLLLNPCPIQVDRTLLESLFGYQAIEVVLSDIRALI